jgi:hypothetical protein
MGQAGRFVPLQAWIRDYGLSPLSDAEFSVDAAGLHEGATCAHPVRPIEPSSADTH